MKIIFKYTLFIIAYFTVTGLYAQLPQKAVELPQKTNILFVLDASGSMLAPWDGKKRMDVAKDILSHLVDSLKNVPNLELGLRVYGHQYDKKFQNCKDSKLEVAIEAKNHDRIKNVLKDIRPQGVTPLAYSIEQSANDFTLKKDTRNILIVITDGLESCGGDPCAISLALQKKHIFLRPFVVGIGMNESEFAKQFECIGQYYNANNTKTFESILSSIITQTLSKAKITVELLDINNKPIETNVNMSFVNAYTGQTEYDYVHFLNKEGKPDALDIDPVPIYNLIVHTIPNVIVRNIVIDKSEKIIRAKTPQGAVKVEMNGSNEYSNLQILLRKKDQAEVIHHFDLNTEQTLLVGKYDIEVLTLPRIVFKDVSVQQSSIQKLNIVAPGRLNINSNSSGYGSLYVLNGEIYEWIQNFDPRQGNMNLPIQPGDYKLVYRAKNAIGSKFTYSSEFKIRQGATTTVKLY